ncbi:MAG: hypothetical protein ACRDEA_09515, partial [Microcystaceae cyanobacterium]
MANSTDTPMDASQATQAPPNEEFVISPGVATLVDDRTPVEPASEVEKRLQELTPEQASAPVEEQPEAKEEKKDDSDLPSMDELGIVDADIPTPTVQDFESPEAKKLDADLQKILGLGLKDIAAGAQSLKEVQQYFQQVQQE